VLFPKQSLAADGHRYIEVRKLDTQLRASVRRFKSLGGPTAQDQPRLADNPKPGDVPLPVHAALTRPPVQIRLSESDARRGGFYPKVPPNSVAHAASYQETAFRHPESAPRGTYKLQKTLNGKVTSMSAKANSSILSASCGHIYALPTQAVPSGSSHNSAKSPQKLLQELVLTQPGSY
jgi:hypothetical protein